jgi:hypothetical protein
MMKFLRRIAEAIKREPPELARIDHAPLVTDEPMREVDRELDSGYEPEAFDERRD